MMSCPYSRETSPPVSGVGAGHPGSWQGGTCNLPWSLLRSTLAGSRSGHWSHWCWCHWSLHVVTVVVWAGAQSVPDWDAGTSQQQHCHQPAQRPSQAGCCGLVVAHRGTLASTPPVVTHATTPRRHTAAWLLAPGSWLTSPSIAHYRGAAVCPAPWQCGHTGWGRAESAAAVSRIAAVQPSSGVLWPARQQPHTAAASTDRISVGRVSAGSSEHLQQLTSSSCPASWGRGWRWWRGCCWWPRSPLLGAAAAEEME